jgi:hypothetical protein
MKYCSIVFNIRIFLLFHLFQSPFLPGVDGGGWDIIPNLAIYWLGELITRRAIMFKCYISLFHIDRPTWWGLRGAGRLIRSCLQEAVFNYLLSEYHVLKYPESEYTIGFCNYWTGKAGGSLLHGMLHGRKASLALVFTRSMIMPERVYIRDAKYKIWLL